MKELEPRHVFLYTEDIGMRELVRKDDHFDSKKEMSMKHFRLTAIGGFLALVMCAVVAGAVADGTRLTIIYDAGLHGKYIPCG